MAGDRCRSISSCAGGFRTDLTFRINGNELRLPPLRDRPNQDGLTLRLFAETRTRPKAADAGGKAYA